MTVFAVHIQSYVCRDNLTKCTDISNGISGSIYCHLGWFSISIGSHSASWTVELRFIGFIYIVVTRLLITLGSNKQTFWRKNMHFVAFVEIHSRIWHFWLGLIRNEEYESGYLEDLLHWFSFTFYACLLEVSRIYGNKILNMRKLLLTKSRKALY